MSLLRFLCLLGSLRLLGFLGRRLRFGLGLGFGLRLWLLVSGRRGRGRRGRGWFGLRRVGVAGRREPSRRRLGWRWIHRRWRGRARRRLRSRSFLGWGSWRWCRRLYSLLGDYGFTLDGLEVVVKEIVIGAASELVVHFLGRVRSVQTGEYAKLDRT